VDTRTLLEGTYDLDTRAILEAEGLAAPGIELEAAVEGDPLEVSLTGRLALRTHAIAYGVAQTCARNEAAILAARDHIAQWMETGASVRILGAGRALLAGAMPGNRLAHAGAQVSFMGGMVPMPNSRHGGGVIACSASGHTKAVLEAMEIAKDKKIFTIGIAAAEAEAFRGLCDIFIGIHAEGKTANPLSAMADTGEYIIAELLDGLVVAAGQLIGLDEDGWRSGHEDIGPTGPYAPLGPRAAG